MERRDDAPTIVALTPLFAASPRVGARVCFTLGNKRVILSLNLACSNLYGGREAVGVKLAQLFFIPLHLFHLSPAFRSLGKRLFSMLPRMTPGLLGFYWTAVQIQAIKVGVTFVLKKKKEASSVCGGFFLLCFKEANTAKHSSTVSPPSDFS